MSCPILGDPLYSQRLADVDGRPVLVNPGQTNKKMKQVTIASSLTFSFLVVSKAFRGKVRFEFNRSPKEYAFVLSCLSNGSLVVHLLIFILGFPTIWMVYRSAKE